MKHSGLGIASFIISIIAGLLLLTIIAAAGYFEATMPGGMSEDSIQAMIVGLIIILAAAGELVAFSLGVVSLFAKDRKKIFGILGTLFSAGAVAGTMGLFLIGLMAG